MLADILGTTWFFLLVGTLAFIGGVYLSASIKKRFGK